jgi:cytochrome b
MTAKSGQIRGQVRVWDLPVRLFHWLIVGLFGFSWWSGENHEMEWHRWSGYAALALLVFRIYWGFAGERTARFAAFLRGPGAVLAYARSLAQRPYVAAQGHNPLGGWSVMLMLSALTVQVTAGLFSVDVDGLESGPLADYVSFETGRSAAKLHHLVFNIALAVVAVHIAAIAFYRLWLRTDLITPMITGKRESASPDAVAVGTGLSRRALLGVIVAAALAYAVSTGFRF